MDLIVLLQVSVSFKDVTINFNREKWQHLDSAQECLYWDVTLGNYHHLASVGKNPMYVLIVEWPSTIKSKRNHTSEVSC
uniref:KRAB domain-containing protein n=1 Tax=Marmota marmota marmota TaxID=9994 RepID=A0A8C6ETL8_MARMA